MKHLTAISLVREMIESLPDRDMARKMEAAIGPAKHPQARTKVFHQFYKAPIKRGTPDIRFSHMSDERCAFRLGFILEEFMEILRDGFGIEMEIEFSVPPIRPDDDESNVSTLNCSMQECLVRMMGRANHRNLIEVADGLGDLNVVVNGFALELGIDMDIVDREIAASNFTKMGEDGNPIIGDGTTGPVGKVLKGPNFMKPQLERIIQLKETK